MERVLSVHFVSVQGRRLTDQCYTNRERGLQSTTLAAGVGFLWDAPLDRVVPLHVRRSRRSKHSKSHSDGRARTHAGAFTAATLSIEEGPLLVPASADRAANEVIWNGKSAVVPDDPTLRSGRMPENPGTHVSVFVFPDSSTATNSPESFTNNPAPSDPIFITGSEALPVSRYRW